MLMLLGGFQGNRCDFKLENRMYIHVFLALSERYIIYHLFNQLLWFLKEKKPIDGGEGGFTSHRLSRYGDQKVCYSHLGRSIC